MKKYGIVMFSMGGPEKLSEVEDYFEKICQDGDIMSLPLQKLTGKIIYKIGVSKLKKQYAQINGYDPLIQLTRNQGIAMIEQLRTDSNEHFNYYLSMRYTEPSLHKAIQDMERDGITDVIAFPQYPQYSCVTTGSSLNEIADYYKNKECNMRWSVIDNWADDKYLIDAWYDIMKKSIRHKNEKEIEETLFVFSGHSLKVDTFKKGDRYIGDTFNTIHSIIKKFDKPINYKIAWQSVHGPGNWVTPSLDETIDKLMSDIEKGNTEVKEIIIVPIVFTVDNMETVFELDIDVIKKYNSKYNSSKVSRVETLNNHPIFIKCLCEMVKEHVKSRNSIEEKLRYNSYTKCSLKCENERCKERVEFFAKQLEKVL